MKIEDARDARAVLVTTEFRGVFFGYIDKEPGRTLTLSNARNCIYWSKDVGGFLGLAEKGPSEDCRIGARAEKLTLYCVTSVSHVSEQAIVKWEAANWK